MTEIMDRLSEIEKKKERYLQGGTESSIARQHKSGKWTARERMNGFFEKGKFREIGLWALPLRTGFRDTDTKFFPGDAVISGFGKVNGRPVCAYAHDFTQMGGTQSAVQHSKVSKTMDMAVEMGVPYVGIVDCAGIRLQDMMGEPLFRARVGGYGVGGTGSFMYSPPWASGVVPQISVMLGPQFAGSSYSPIMSDFLIMRRSPAVFMSLVSPPVIKQVTGEEVTYKEIGEVAVHAEVSGIVDIVVDTDEEALETCRELLSFLPQNCKETPPVVDTDDPPDRREEALLDLAPMKSGQEYDMHAVIKHIVDNQHFFEIKEGYAKNIIVGFARLAGNTVGIVANNRGVLDGIIDANSADKSGRFIRFCDAFNIPLVFLVDSTGFACSPEDELLGAGRHIAKLPFAICEATVPKMTVYIGDCSGEAEFVMGTEAMGSNLVVAWPSAKIGFMDAEEAVDEFYKNEIESADKPDEARKEKIEEFNQKYNSLIWTGARQLIQDIIDPRDTRAILTDALTCFANKDELRPWKKHSNIPL